MILLPVPRHHSNRFALLRKYELILQLYMYLSQLIVNYNLVSLQCKLWLLKFKLISEIAIDRCFITNESKVDNRFNSIQCRKCEFCDINVIAAPRSFLKRKVWPMYFRITAKKAILSKISYHK